MGLRFSDMDFDSLQAFLWPMIEVLTGIDIGKKIGMQADSAFAIRDVLAETAEVFDAVGLAITDGKVSSDEINVSTIITNSI